MKTLFKKYKRYAVALVLGSTAIATGTSLVASERLVQIGDQQVPTITVYKSPQCGCCGRWIEHLINHGFSVTIENHNNLSAVKNKLGIPNNLRSCHSAKIGEYVVEGHVPAEDILRLLRDKPGVTGIAVPGMPIGSPGMEGAVNQPYNVYSFDEKGSNTVFSKH